MMINLKNALDHKLKVRSNGFSVGTCTWYILQFVEEINKRTMSLSMSYEYFFGEWLNSWCTWWFVSIWKSLTKDKKGRNDVGSDAWLVECNHNLHRHNRSIIKVSSILVTWRISLLLCLIGILSACIMFSSCMSSYILFELWETFILTGWCCWIVSGLSENKKNRKIVEIKCLKYILQLLEPFFISTLWRHGGLPSHTEE